MPSQTDAANRDHTGQLFSPHSIIWQVDREMALLLAGGRALLLQLAHPKVAAGVAQYSRFQQNPLARLQRTMSAMWSIGFDESAKAYAALQRVGDIHKRVHGTVEDHEAVARGTPYDARDPQLLMWVHATLIDSAMVAYDLFVKPLSLQEKARYYEESKKLAE
ncbi:MAG TPA: oxygenase MpaB family protein, partial [Candidatus Binatia bacterium]|nr:oxygenase MpaB family protein [Candidatus Binatia bacterium]